jgi:import inner membrane translocase subunit TIM17
MNTVPCPGRIVIDLGDGFSTGCVLGALWYFAKGSYYAVRRERIKGGLMLLRSRAPILGGSFGLWAGVFSISCCIMVRIRQKEDPINSIIAGFSTGFILAIRGGLRTACRNALIGGIFLTIIEGLMIMYQQSQKRTQIIEENKMYNKYKRDMERQHGIKFKENVKLDPYNSQRSSKILKADLVGSSDTISKDSASKLI